MKMNKIVFCITMCFSLALTGCGDDKEEENNASLEETSVIREGDYAALLPFQSNDARYKHAETSTDQTDTFAISSGLIELSKEYFSPSSYAYKESDFLTYDVLDAVLDGSGLLGRTSDTNPKGLNPEVGTEFDTNSGKKKITSMDVVLLDIYEIDWYKSKELKGLTIGVILNDEIGDAEDPYTITDAALKQYGEDVGLKVVDYLRKTYPEIGNKTPILVALFRASGANESLPGTFLESAYFESKTSGQYKTIDEKWAYFPSSLANDLDVTNYDYFNRFVKGIRDFFPEDMSISGKGHFLSGSLTSLRIDIIMHAKTGMEVNAAVQQINSSLSIFESTSFDIKVYVESDGEPIAIIQRESGSSSTTVSLLID